VNNGLFEVMVLETQNLLGLRVVDAVQLNATETRAGLANGHAVIDLRDLLPQDVNELLVAEVSASNKEALTTSLGQLVGLQVSLSHIAHIHPRPESVGWNGVSGLGVGRHQPVDISGGGVEFGKV